MNYIKNELLTQQNLNASIEVGMCEDTIETSPFLSI